MKPTVEFKRWLMSAMMMIGAVPCGAAPMVYQSTVVTDVKLAGHMYHNATLTLAFTLGTAMAFSESTPAPLATEANLSGNAWSCIGYPPTIVGTDGNGNGPCFSPDVYPRGLLRAFCQDRQRSRANSTRMPMT